MDSLPATAVWFPDRPQPDAIPDFQLIRRIGKGGFGEVWLAENRTTGGLRAVKLIALNGSQPAALAGREIASLSRLERNRSIKHPHLLEIHHVGKTDDYLYYVMDLADDITGVPASREETYIPATLGKRLRAGRLPVEDCLGLSRQLLSALSCLHAAGLVHRDVKPENCVFLNGELKLADFGLVTESTTDASRAGTLKYMPHDRIMDVRADVFAAGIVIYEMYTGNPVDRFPSLVPHHAEISADRRLGVLNRIVLQATNQIRENRFCDATEMLSELDRLLTLESSQGPQTAGQANRSTAFLRSVSVSPIVIVLSLILLLGALLGSFVFTQRPTRSRVHVNFISIPYGAHVEVDGKLMTVNGEACATPCTIAELTAEPHRIILRHPEFGVLDVGSVDLAEIREVSVDWISHGSQN